MRHDEWVNSVSFDKDVVHRAGSNDKTACGKRSLGSVYVC